MKKLLENNIELYHRLIDDANVIINGFDAEGNVLIWNKAAEEITGYAKGEVVGNKKVLPLLYPDPDVRRDVLKSIGAALKENFKNVEFTLKTKYGDKKRISWSAIVIRDKDGAVVGSFAIGIDVTLKNLVKARERESFRALLKSVRLHEEAKQHHEETVRRLKDEINALCRDFGQPPRY